MLSIFLFVLELRKIMLIKEKKRSVFKGDGNNLSGNIYFLIENQIKDRKQDYFIKNKIEIKNHINSK